MVSEVKSLRTVETESGVVLILVLVEDGLRESFNEVTWTVVPKS